MLRLELSGISEEVELPLATFISSILHVVWEKRMKSARISAYDVRCTLEARCQILRESRFLNAATMLHDMILLL